MKRKIIKNYQFTCYIAVSEKQHLHSVDFLIGPMTLLVFVTPWIGLGRFVMCAVVGHGTQNTFR